MRKTSLDLSVARIIGVKEQPKFDDHFIYAGHAVSGHGKHRLISAPNKTMLAIHRELVRQLRDRKIFCPSATGCKIGDSPWKNVIRHRISNDHGWSKGFPRYFYLLDLKSAYEMVQLPKLIEAIKSFFPEQDGVVLEKFLTAYCFHPKRGGLYTGSPSSPDLFNLYCEYFLDKEIRQICNRYQLVYSRYLDDLTFSAQQPIGAHKRKEICRLIREACFEISTHKVKVYDLKKGVIAINGIGIRPDGTTFLPRANAEEISAFIYRVNKNLLREWNESKLLGTAPQKEFKQRVLILYSKDISTVHGKIGLFFSTCGKNAVFKSSLERRIVERYNVFRYLLSELQSGKRNKKRKRPTIIDEVA